jgi:NTP pyrophosphatase (non-canonical NTP hydrolase)
MTIKDLCKKAHKLAIDKGFWNFDRYSTGKKIKFVLKKRNLSELLMLIVSELGEACEALRKNIRQQPEGYYTIDNKNKLFKSKEWIKDTFEDELADAVIRICDLAESEGIDLEWQIQKKLEYNKTRPHKHGKEF